MNKKPTDDDYDHGIGDMIRIKKESKALLPKYQQIIKDIDSIMSDLRGYATDWEIELGEEIASLEVDKDDLSQKLDVLKTKISKINTIKTDLERNIKEILETSEILEDYEDSSDKINELKQDFIRQIDKVIEEKNTTEVLDFRFAKTFENHDKIEKHRDNVKELEELISYLEEEGNALNIKKEALEEEIESAFSASMDNANTAHNYYMSRDKLAEIKKLLELELDELEQGIQDLERIV